MKKIVNLKISKLLGHGLFYTVAIGIESISPFILAPVLTHYISIYEYGLWAIFQSTTAFLRPLLGMTFDDYIRMRYYQQSRDKTVGYLFSIILLSAMFAMVLWAICLMFGSSIGHILQFPSGWLWTIIAGSWLYAIFYILLAYFQFDSRKVRFAMIHLAQAAISLLCSVSMVISGFGWVSAVVGKLLGLSCASILAFIWVFSGFPKSAEKYIQPRHVLELLSFGWRYMGNGMVVVVVVLTDRLMLANMENIQATSLFSVASLFPTVLVIPIQGFIFGWQPWCFERLARRDSADQTHLALGAAFYAIALPIGGIILSCISCWIGPYIIDKQFAPAFAYVFPLTMAMVAQGFYQFAQTILQYYQRLGVLSWIAYMVMALNLALNFILIPMLGTIGSAWATCSAYTVAFLLVAIAAINVLHKNYLNNL